MKLATKSPVNSHLTMMIRRFFLLVLCVLTTVDVVRAQSVISTVSPVSGHPNTVGTAYPLQIAAGDLLNVTVFDTPELSAKLRVDEHGSVTLPLAGALPVSGMTAEQAAHSIESRFRESNILNDPHASVTVLEYATQGVTVLGEVKNPGVYPLLGSHGVLDLISAAGGVTTLAGKAVTISHRADSDHPVIVRLESKAGASAAFNVDVRPGDTVIVSHAGIVYVVGDVGKPGGFLIENNDRLTVLQAIALAQGTNRTASLNHAKIIRKTETGRQEMAVPLKKILATNESDVALNDGDILFVPSSAAKSAWRDAQSILPSVASAALYKVP